MGFKITRDYVKDEGEKGCVGLESVRQRGINAFFLTEKEQEQAEYHGGKIKVRLRDEDNNIHFHAVVDDEDFSCELLLRWGGTYSGATDLDLYKEDWDRLTNNREHPYVSKDGKWVYYMG